jgi:hypothetical protein
MGNSSQAVYIKSGEQPRSFYFGNAAAQTAKTTTVQASQPMYKESVYSSFQAILTGTGALTATVTIQATNDDNTGRGYVFGNDNAPGSLVTTTNASATLASASVTFTAEMVGMSIVAPGVPAGTTVTAVATGGASLTMSATATASATVQANFFANNWLATVLGTITLSGTGSGAGTLNGVSDGLTTIAPWRYVRMNVTALTGTGATVTGVMGV